MNNTPANEIDVAALLAALRAEVRARRLSPDQTELSAVEQELRRSLDDIELHRVVSAHWPLISHSLPQRAINLVNKIVRRGLRWYINPIVEQQNAYNDAVARTLRLFDEAYTDLAEQIRNLPQAPVAPAAPPPAPSAERPVDAATAQAVVAARGAAEDARLPDLELQAQMPHLHDRQHVNAHWPLVGTTLPQKGVAFAQKVVRQYLRWLINPVVQQQNAANGTITAVLAALAQADGERRAQVAALRAKQRR